MNPSTKENVDHVSLLRLLLSPKVFFWKAVTNRDFLSNKSWTVINLMKVCNRHLATISLMNFALCFSGCEGLHGRQKNNFHLIYDILIGRWWCFAGVPIHENKCDSDSRSIPLHWKARPMQCCQRKEFEHFVSSERRLEWKWKPIKGHCGHLWTGCSRYQLSQNVDKLQIWCLYKPQMPKGAESCSGHSRIWNWSKDKIGLLAG